MIVDVGKLRDHATRRIAQLAPIQEERDAASTIHGLRNLLRMLETVEIIARTVPTCFIDVGEPRAVWIRNDPLTHALVSRHHPGRFVPLSAVNEWSDEQVHAAEMWAHAMETRAGEGSIPLPRTPEHVAHWSVHGVQGG